MVDIHMCKLRDTPASRFSYGCFCQDEHQQQFFFMMLAIMLLLK